MELYDALLRRRSTRKFKSDKVSDSTVKELLIAAMSAPSACNKTPWEFFVIRGEENLKRILRASLFSRYDAPLAIVLCANLENALPEPLCEYWVQDLSAATENILLRATDLGLGSVWCGIYPQETPMKRVCEILSLPDSMIPLNVILIGYPDEDLPPRTQYDEKKIHYL